MELAYTIPQGSEQPGDLFFEAGTAISSKIIRLSQLSSHSHVGILIRPESDGEWMIAEANAKGFCYKKRAIPAGYVVRLPGDQATEIVLAARHLVSRKTKYDFVAIAFHAGRFLERWWPTFVAGQFIKRFVRPVARRKNRVICSEAALICLREVGAWPDLIGQFDHLVGFEVSPTDLLRALLGHRESQS
jgi:hypothetical protein